MLGALKIDTKQSRAYGVIVNADFSGLWLAQKFAKAGIELVHVRTNEVAPRPTGGDLYESVFSQLLTCSAASFESHLPLLRDAMFILPGSEAGVLPAHDINRLISGVAVTSRNISAFVDKAEMYRAATAGLIPIPETYLLGESSDISTVPPNVVFAGCVLKPAMSYGSDNVHYCSSFEDVRLAFEAIKGSTNFHGLANEVVVLQQRIFARQCFINAVSIDGVHTVTDIWIRDRPVFDDTLTWIVELVDMSSAAATELIAFTNNLLNSFGLRFGASHTEAFITEKGPVLIETAARHAGRTISEEALKKVLPITQLDLLALATLDPGRYREDCARIATRMLYGVIVPIFSDRSGILSAYFDIAPLESLPTFASFERKYLVGEPISSAKLVGTSVAFILLCHKNRRMVEADLLTLRRLHAEGALAPIVQ